MRRSIGILGTLVFLLSTAARGWAAGAASAPAADETTIDTEAAYAFIEEVETGTVLLAKDADARLYPASMNKMMTAYIVFGMLKDGRTKLSDTLPVSKRAWRLGGSKMFVPYHGNVSIDDLLQGMIVDSGNDAALVLAQGLAGSEAGFVKLMNEKAKEIGLKGSHFTDVTGLPNPDDWMTAHDLAILAMRTIEDFPQYYHYYTQKSFTFDKITQQNRNPLLYRHIGADGLKTGYTEASGYSLTAALHDGKRRIVMVLSGLPTKRARAEESERLGRWALREFADYPLFSAGETIENAPVWLGASASVPLVVKKGLLVTLPKPSRPQMKVTIRYKSPIPAPIRKGEPLGTITVSAPQAKSVAVPLAAGAAVAPMGRFARISALAGYLVWGKGR